VARANAPNSASIIAVGLILTTEQRVESFGIRPYSGGTHGCSNFRDCGEAIFSAT
jgi:hypothetical protein